MKASGSATVSSAMSSAAACCCIWSMRTGEHAGKAYKTVRGELEAYGERPGRQARDRGAHQDRRADADELKKQIDRLKRAAKKTPLLISGVTGEGVPEVLRALVEVIGEAPVADKAEGAMPAAAMETPSPATALA